ncbi:Uncharacterized conserved protein YehS, DUF1456 family [Saccharicrinis carchari]|uniref:Uncharacterized conserved protein YehS, DUF1456 family n=1 Tax=Saccharicrinis carchari TaxID=1168039 RepID=A0A521CQG4_SACCC|nr:DUF1456 family protein [Saccharicrinis carchari]SMO61646.1 Uncharacterized conserved protein YehS, DUF1456 family [Saccharicrinis carchari]
MNNNDVLKSLRYTFDFSDNKMIEIFGLAKVEVNRAQVSDWLKKEEDESFKTLIDSYMSAFLNGLIILKRGAKDGQAPVNEKRLNNNLILRKLKIALALKDHDMIELLSLADFKISKHEISAFFRKPGQNQYRVCKDQILRKLMFGLQKKIRP